LTPRPPPSSPLFPYTTLFRSKNTIYQWQLGDKGKTDAAFQSAAHVTKLDIVNNRLVPNAIEPRAAIGEYDSGTGHFTLWNTTQKDRKSTRLNSSHVKISYAVF